MVLIKIKNKKRKKKFFGEKPGAENVGLTTFDAMRQVASAHARNWRGTNMCVWVFVQLEILNKF